MAAKSLCFSKGAGSKLIFSNNSSVLTKLKLPAKAKFLPGIKLRLIKGWQKSRLFFPWVP